MQPLNEPLSGSRGKMDAIEKERLYIEASILELKEYLLSPVLFWPVSVTNTSREERATIPKLTPGNLYLSIRKLQSYGFPIEKKREVEELIENISTIIREWQSGWRKKAEKEFQIRIRQWGTYLNDIKHDRRINQASFAYQVRDRVILDLLNDELKLAGNIENQKILALDDTVRQLTKPGGFLWEDEFIQGFPQKTFWYLYVDVQTK